MSSNVEANEPDEGPHAWVLDSLVGFLKSPIWNLPLLTFVEQRSVVFEPDDDDEPESNELEYEKIFEEYKNLVDRLLGSHMDDLAITEEQFEEACRNAEGALSAKFHQTLFEQIWAANDYDIFKRMMIQRNIDLQLQALELLAHKYGLVPESFIPQGSSKEDYLKNEDALLEAVIKRSLEEHESEKQLETVSLQIEQELSLDDKFVEHVEVHSIPSGPSKPATSALRRDSKGDINPTDIKSRQEYLRRQRDKLLQTKKKERQTQMTKVGNSELMTKRPMSAKTLRSVVHGDISPEQETVDRGLAFRKSLASRLQAEIAEMKEPSN